MKTRFAMMLGLLVSLACQVSGDESDEVLRNQKVARAIEDLSNPNSHWREMAIWKLEELEEKTPQVISRLEKALDDEVFGVQKAAAKTLAKIAPKTERLRTLADGFLISDEASHVRRTGYEIHRDIGNPIWKNIDQLRANFESNDWRRKRLAATLIDHSNNRNGRVKVYVPEQAEFADELLACLTDAEHEDLRYAAVQALDGLRHFSKPVLERMIDHLAREPSKKIRVEILRTVGAIGVPENYDAVPALIEVFLNDDEGAVRLAATGALAIGWPSAGTDALPALIESIVKDDHHSVASSAAEAIADIDPEGRIALPLLVELLEMPPPNDSAWKYTLRAIENLGPAAASATGRVRKLLEHSNPVVSRAAAAALATISDQDEDAQIATLALAVRDKYDVRSDAIWTLRRIRSRPAAAVLVETLADQRPLAIKHFQRAADAGEPDGDYQLGLIYLNGPASLRDDEKAVLHLTRAAEKDHLDGCFETGLLYLRGDLVERNLETADFWFRRGRAVSEIDEAANRESEFFSRSPSLSERFASFVESHRMKKTRVRIWDDEPDESAPIFILSEIGIGTDDGADFGMTLKESGECISDSIGYGLWRSGSIFPDKLQLTPEAVKAIRELHASLPPSIQAVPHKDTLLYSFNDPETENWTTRIYHTRALPDSIREICRLVERPTLSSRRDPRLILDDRVERISTGAFSPDGSLTICGYKSIRRWTPEGHEESVPEAYDHMVFSIAADATRYVQYGTPTQIVSTDNFEPIAEFQRKGFFRDSAFSENSRFLGFFHSNEKTIESYDAQTGKPVARSLHHSPWSNSVAVSNDGNTLAGLKSRKGNHAAILIYRAGEPEPALEIGDFLPPPEPNRGSDYVEDLRFLDGNPNRLLVVTRRRVVTWDIKEHRALSEFAIPFHTRVVAASSSGQFVAALWGETHTQIWVWDTETGQRIATLDEIFPSMSYEDHFSKMIFSRNGDRIAAWNDKGRLASWDLTAPN